jgi:predicted RNA-binding protein associated with RNAse of E/G family
VTSDECVTGQRVVIKYRRLPDRVTTFEQICVHDDGDVIVTLAPDSRIAKPMSINGAIALEPTSPVVWFTFPGRYHDIGRFHSSSDAFTGLYGNVITPVLLENRCSWSTTDLFLDLWLAKGSDRLQLLDEDELEAARAHGWISDDETELAWTEIVRIQQAFAAGEWPPAAVHEWTLERARAVAGHSG